MCEQRLHKLKLSFGDGASPWPFVWFTVSSSAPLSISAPLNISVSHPRLFRAVIQKLGNLTWRRRLFSGVWMCSFLRYLLRMHMRKTNVSDFVTVSILPRWAELGRVYKRRDTRSSEEVKEALASWEQQSSGNCPCFWQHRDRLQENWLLCECRSILGQGRPHSSVDDNESGVIPRLERSISWGSVSFSCPPYSAIGCPQLPALPNWPSLPKAHLCYSLDVKINFNRQPSLFFHVCRFC